MNNKILHIFLSCIKTHDSYSTSSDNYGMKNFQDSWFQSNSFSYDLSNAYVILHEHQ